MLAGCGGQSNGQQIRNVVNDFTVDLGQGHASAACKLTTGQLRTVCNEGGVQLVASKLGSFTSLTISKVVVQGSSATVAFNASSEVISLSKQNGKWLIGSA